MDVNSKLLQLFSENSRILYTEVEVISVIGERLAEIRKDHGDTQQTLADKLNVSKFTVSNWEQGKSAPDHGSLIRICQLYHVSSDYLLGLSDDDPLLSKQKRDVLCQQDQELLKEMEAFLRWRSSRKKVSKE